jgi:inosose dehydratase
VIPRRAATVSLERASIGVVPIVWNNVDLAEGQSLVPAETVLDEVVRLGYEGCQFGRGFPSGDELSRALEDRRLRLAEVYVALPFPASERDARAVAKEGLDCLHAVSGDVLVIALADEGQRDRWAGRAANPAAPRLSDHEWRALARLLDDIAREATAAGHGVAFHAHTGTYVETPAELDRLVAETDPRLVGVCLDTGHYIVGGGDPVTAVRMYGERLRHIHVKDVDERILARLQAGEFASFRAAIQDRLFTELGSGLLDLDGVLAELAALDYGGWMMVEQDTTRLRPSEAAAIGRRVLGYAIRRISRQAAA